MMATNGKENIMTADNKGVLKFKPGEEYKIKIEEPGDFSASIFRDLYEKAFKHVKTIISTQLEGARAQDDATKDTYNNVIAFAGGRGSGKSSVMISFRDAVKSLKKLDKINAFNNLIDTSLKESHFETIDIIDPSMFEESDSILEIIVAQLFRRFDNKIKDQDSQSNYNNKRELLECFQGVYDNLKTIQKKGHERLDGEVIETLSKLASGSNLKSTMIDLVKKYLKFMSNGQDQPRFLLIAIDDFDLNTGHVYSMAEQIRKYLVIPEVIILMAVKIDQLSSIIESKWRTEFDKMIEKKRMDPDEPHTMTTRYLEKLIPENRRLYLPQIRYNENKNIEIRIPKEDIKEQYDDVQVEDAILELIYSKTGLIFLRQEYNVHFLIPDNLRELHGLYVLLMNLDNVDITEMLNEKAPEEKKNKIDKIRSNFKRFEDYFLYTWVKNKLSFEDQNTVEDFMTVDIRQKNKHIIQELDKKITLEQPTKSTESEEDIEYWLNYKDYPNIIQKSNNPLNISLGDVLYCLKLLVALNDTEDNQLFAFALKTVYSLILFKLIIIEDKYQDVQVLLGGSIYNPSDMKLIRYSSNQKDRRDYFEFAYRDIVGDLFGDENNWEFIEWLHYFLLFVGKKDEKRFRKSDDKYYDNETNLGLGNISVRHATFDVLAFIFFVFDPYRVTKKSFQNYGLCCNGFIEAPDSIYNQVIKWRDRYRTALPVYSIEFLEQILLSNIKLLKTGSGDDYSTYLSNFIAQLIKSINVIIGNNTHLNVTWILEAFNECPIIRYAQNTEKYETIKLMNKLFKEKEKKEDILSEFDPEKALNILNLTIKNIIEIRNEEEINIRQIKTRTSKFIKNLSNQKIDGKEALINEIVEKRNEMDNIQEKKDINFLLDQIIEILGKKVEELNG